VKKLSLLTVALSAGALFGQSSGGEARIQLFGDMMRPSDQVIAKIGSVSVTDQAKAQTGFGVRFMGEIPGTSNWFYQLGGRLESTSKFETNGTVSPGIGVDATDVKFGYSYWSIGGGYMWHFDAFTLGTHLEGRGEAMNARGYLYVSGGTGSGPVDHSVTYLRPWVRVSGDWSWKAGSVQPYVGIDASLAITKTSQNSVSGLTILDDRNLKAMAPNASFGLYLGIKF